MDNTLLENASRCPVCESRPVESREQGYQREMVFLRCPLGHPYVICGNTITMAIAHWDEYIAFQIMQDTSKMFDTVRKNIGMSYCRHCKRYTKSDTTFDKVESNGSHLGYSVTRHQCLECHLIKSQKEAA